MTRFTSYQGVGKVIQAGIGLGDRPRLRQGVPVAVNQLHAPLRAAINPGASYWNSHLR